MIDLTMREGATAGGEGRPAQQESAEPTVRERTVRERTALRRPVERLMPSIARVLRLETRTSDLLARVGPGRIVAFLPATSGAQAAIVAERVRRSCGGWLDSVRVPVRLSVASADLVESGGIDAAFAALERSVERGADGETSSRGAS
ncbi:MAG TPA: hypothetical protein VIV06_02330 [Candidatus Limnocylindrales bacterium]